jgi:hypothetical protein
VKKILFAVVAGLVMSLGAVETASAGSPDGARFKYVNVQARSVHVERVAFYAGEEAVVTVVGDGDTDVDLEIYDATGTLVASDYGLTDNCICRWVPSRDQVYTIRVINLGGVYNRCRVAHN